MTANKCQCTAPLALDSQQVAGMTGVKCHKYKQARIANRGSAESNCFWRPADFLSLTCHKVKSELS